MLPSIANYKNQFTIETGKVQLSHQGRLHWSGICETTFLAKYALFF